MDAIKINVNKQMDGYSFSISPTTREYIKHLFPDAQPATNIFVGYDTKSDFETYVSKLENNIYPALLGVYNERDLNELGEILFIDTQTKNILYKVAFDDEKV